MGLYKLAVNVNSSFNPTLLNRNLFDRQSLSNKASPLTMPSHPTTSAGPSLIEQGQGDGMHNCEPLGSPVKKFRVEETPKNMQEPISYVTAEGSIEFRKRSSKKLQPETKWSRSCKMHVAYSNTSLEDYTVYLIIYEGGAKCRRNLTREFEKDNVE